MKGNKLFIFISVILFSLKTAAEVPFNEPSPAVFFVDTIETGRCNKEKIVIRKKITAIGLAVAFGPFGVHRLYLGTDPKIPVIYSITLGGFGVLPLADIIAIIISRDIEQFENNPEIIMWMK